MERRREVEGDGEKERGREGETERDKETKGGRGRSTVRRRPHLSASVIDVCKRQRTKITYCYTIIVSTTDAT